MKKIFALALILAIFSVPASAAKKRAGISSTEVKNLISRIERKIESRKEKLSKLDTKIVRFFLSPSQPKQNENVVVFAQISSRFLDSDTFLEATFDSAPVSLEKSAAELWAFDAGTFAKIADHTFTANVFIQDSAAAAELKSAISALDSAISILNEQIEEEEDENARNQLIAERDLKVGQRAELILALDGLKKSVATETLTFSIAENPSAPGFPRIQSVSPRSGPEDGGTIVTVQGENFANDMEGTLGGLPIALNYISSTKLSFETPFFNSVTGPLDLEITTSGANPKNAVRKNAFYVIPDLIGNKRPVAVAGPSQAILLGASANLNGSSSYDDNGHGFSYSWIPVSAPAGSNAPIDEVFSTEAQFTFTPSKPGHYVWQLTTTEVGPDPALVSEASLTVLSVNPPANSAPAPSASAIGVVPEGTATTQIAHGDVDGYQAHSYRVIKQSDLGAASVSSTGLITFTAGTLTGSGDIDVLVMDNGTPPLSSVISIPVMVGNSTIVVDDLYAQVIARNGFITVAMGADTLNTTAPGIKSVVWDFGDGTSGASPYPNPNDGYVEHDYLVAGTYTATATLTDSYGNTGSKSFTFSTGTSAMPVPHVVSDVYSGPAPLTVNFDATGSTDDVGINQYRFRWFDGTPDTSNATGLVTHTFNEEGNYRVRLRTRDADFNIAHAFIDIHVGSSPATEMSRPMPFISMAAKEVVIGSPHSFSGSNSFDPNPSGAITAYRWNFGDFQNCDSEDPNPGCVATGATQTHSYSFADAYWTSLEVEGALGGVQTALTQVFSVTTGHAPRAMPGRSFVEGVAPFTLNVDGSHSFDYDGTISAFEWHFNDPSCTSGCDISQAIGSYTYNEPGEYFVSHAVVDNDGNRHDAGFRVMVYPSEQVKADMQARAKAKAREHVITRSSEKDRERDRLKNVYTQLCSRGKVSACHDSGKLYEEDGNSFGASKFFEKACSLGYVAACPVKK